MMDAERERGNRPRLTGAGWGLIGGLHVFDYVQGFDDAGPAPPPDFSTTSYDPGFNSTGDARRKPSAPARCWPKINGSAHRSRPADRHGGRALGRSAEASDADPPPPPRGGSDGPARTSLLLSPLQTPNRMARITPPEARALAITPGRRAVRWQQTRPAPFWITPVSQRSPRSAGRPMNRRTANRDYMRGRA